MLHSAAVMRVAIVHYHLQQGGVTQVIRSQSRLLARQGIPHVILAESGDAGELPVRWIAGLGYTDDFCDGEKLLSRMISAATNALGGMPYIWHFHNPSLGKNPQIPELILRLARENQRLLLHIHDLAEDGREENFRRIPCPSELHPDGPRIARAFLNLRDLGIFIDAGLNHERAFFLPNTCCVLERRSAAPSHSPALVFCPVRGIRRKNLGEILLLATLSPVGTRYAISRAPLDPQWLAVHDAWRAFAIAHRLPVEFDVSDRIRPALGAGHDFSSWIAHSTHLVTTSVAEGFGLVFLEAGQWGKPLIGRTLPHLPHATGGVGMYQTIRIPGKSGPTDFADLTEEEQRDFLVNLLENPSLRDSVWIDEELAATWLNRALASDEPFQATDLASDGLLEIYSTLSRVENIGVGFLDTGKIRSAYQNIRRSPLMGKLPQIKTKVVVFDIYGTLLHAEAGGVEPDAKADPLLREILQTHGYHAPESPSSSLHQAVLKQHAASAASHPEVDLRDLWREVLGLDHSEDLTRLVIELEAAWHPAELIDGAARMLRRLAADGFVFGLLSNAQCNALDSLGPLASWFARDLTVLSYQHGHAKPADSLFAILTDKLTTRGIPIGEVWFVGNDPLHDIRPAAAHGFRTALFQGHRDSIRPGDCAPDIKIPHWDAFALPHKHTNPLTADAPRESYGEK